MRSIALVLAAVLSGCVSLPREAIEVDVLVRGGTVYPGVAAPFVGDVAVRGNRIVAMGPRLALATRRVIDAKGLVVAPGFIDPHTHIADRLTSDDTRTRLIEPFLLQGVTTAFVGNDGFGPADVAPLLASPATKPVGINYGVFTGFGSIREAVIGNARRAPTLEELAREEALVRTAMCAGAVGLSTGLFYAPQSFAETPEVVALARAAVALGGVYDTHLRDEGSYGIGLAAAVEEAITVAREARIPVQISHLKALGADVHGTAPAIVARIAAARAEGLAVTANQYPYVASGTSLVAALVPLWTQDGGRAAMLRRFDDPAQQARLATDMAETLRIRGGADRLTVIEGRWRGRTLDDIARALGLEPVPAAIAAIREGDAAAISFNMDGADVVTFMRQPWVFTGSDASAGHPRTFGSFAEKYAVYVHDGAILSLRDFIDRSSALTADSLGLKDRGRLRVGSHADIAIFDPDRYTAHATYERPELTASGMRYVLVNGMVAVDDGEVTGTAAGGAIRHQPALGCQ